MTQPIVGKLYRFKSSRFSERIYRVDAIDSNGVHMTIVKADPVEVVKEASVPLFRFANATEVIE
jgi:hypothetical protein